MPTISILMPVYNVPRQFLMDAVASVNRQTSKDWELCIVNSVDDDQRHNNTDVCSRFASPDGRIKVKNTKNLGISGNTNLALEMATGEYIGLLDADDLLAPQAIERVIQILNHYPTLDFVYSDEDKVDEHNRTFDPYHKPSWSPDTLLSKMYTCHFGVYRASLVRRIGGFRPRFDGSQDYDMVLRLTEHTENITHIPEILYHWRVHPGSTAMSLSTKSYAHRAAMDAVQEALHRRGDVGIVDDVPNTGMHNVRYRVADPAKVSIIMPSRDGHALTDAALTSIFEKTTYPNFEVLLVDNASVEDQTRLMHRKWLEREPERFRVIHDDSPFNFSEINNRAVPQTDGKYLLFLNNDVEVITPDWVTGMVGYAQRRKTGVVGVRLLYPDNTVQHAGVVVGLGGAAGHAFLHSSDQDPGYFGSSLTVTNYSAVTAACVMVRRDVFEGVGGFDPEFRVAFNDVDLCLRVQAAGYHNVYLPFVKLYHHESKTRGYEDTPEKKARFDREVRLLQTRWPDLRKDPHYNPNLSLDADYRPKNAQYGYSPYNPYLPPAPSVVEARF